MQFAYDLHNYDLSGGPGWVTTDHYDIVAASPAATTDAQSALMLRQLLAERFGLALHRETKEVSGCRLVTEKVDGRLREPKAAGHGLLLGRNPTSGQRTLHGNSAKIADLA